MIARTTVFVIAIFILAGCASTTPTLDISPEAEMTFDGLYPVEDSLADAAWAREGVELSQYSKILLHNVGVEYRPGGESGRTYHARSQGGPFEVTEKQKKAFERVMKETFREELAKSEHFTLVDEAGPDVLLVRGGLLDVVSYVPADPIGVRDKIFLSRVGEATLVLEVRDSITEAILARAVDRRAAESAFDFKESNRVNNTVEVKRLARTWARILRERLDELGAPGE
jgi:hypothetical protein